MLWFVSFSSKCLAKPAMYDSVVAHTIGIKHDFSFINIRKVPREVLKTEGEARRFQHLPRHLANVNE